MTIRPGLVPMLGLAGLASACASGETGDPCWDDAQCTSWSCSFGTCDSSLVALLGLLVREAAPTQSSGSMQPAASPAPRCQSLDEITCLTTEGCYANSHCVPDPACYQDLSFECLECLSNGCGSPCLYFFSCEAR